MQRALYKVKLHCDRTKYNENGKQAYRDDLTGKPHYSKEEGKYLDKHRHVFEYNDKGLPVKPKVPVIPIP